MSKAKSKMSSSEIIAVYVGIDYHDQSVQVCVMDADGKTLVNRSLANSTAAVVELVRNCNGVVRGVAIEACCGAADFATQLIEATEWTVRLAHAGTVSHLKKTQEKTDLSDAVTLADLLRVGYLPEVWLADEETRQLRRLVRYRQSVVDRRKGAKLRILSLLREERIDDTSGCPTWTKGWMEWVKTVPMLGAASRWVMDQELKVKQDAEDELKEVESKMTSLTKDDELVAKLQKQLGVGLITALTLRAVIGRFDRFRSGKQLSRYCGVTPRNVSSGKRQADAGLVQTGNDILRSQLIQLAKRLPRQDSRWKEFKARMIQSKPANVVSAAIANRWLRRLYHEMVSHPKGTSHC